MKHFIVNIGREFGALGLEIGKRLAKELGVKYYDRELVTSAALKLEMSSSAGHELDESPKPREKRFLGIPNAIEVNRYNQFIAEQASVIRRIAARESCVFIGRCADYILEDMSDQCLNVYVFAPFETRCNHIIGEYLQKEEYSHRGKTEDDYMAFAWEMHSLVKETDEKRHNYYKYVTGEDVDHRRGKQLLIDSSAFGVDGTVRILKSCVYERFGV